MVDKKVRDIREIVETEETVMRQGFIEIIKDITATEASHNYQVEKMSTRRENSKRELQ